MIRAIAGGAIALTALIVAQHLQERVLREAASPTATERALFFSAALLLLVAGIFAIRSTGAAIRRSLEESPGDGRGAPAAFLASVVGYLIVVPVGRGVLGVNLQGLLLGGAVTGVVIGIAAQQTLGNFFAGIVLLAVRPFTVGEEVVLRSSPLGGEYEGRVVDMSLFYVKLETDNGPVALPNAGCWRRRWGRGPRRRKRTRPKRKSHPARPTEAPPPNPPGPPEAPGLALQRPRPRLLSRK